MGTSTERKKDSIAIVAAILLFYFSKPYFFWGSFWTSSYVIVVLSFALGFLFLSNRDSRNNNWGGPFIVFLISLSLFTIFGRHNINFFLSYFAILFIPFATESFSKNVYKYFSNIIIVFLTLSLVAYFAALIGLLPPIKTIEPLNLSKDHNYLVYPLFLVNPTGSPIVRFHGPFDEPGVVGTLCGTLLFIENFNLKKYKSIVLLIAGIVSLSFFFYVCIAIYLVLHIVFERRSVVGSIAMIIVMALAYFLLTRVPFLYDIIGSRFEINEDTGWIAGDNRLEMDFIYYYFYDLFNSGRLLTGIVDKESFSDAVRGSSSYLVIVIYYGLIASIWYIFAFVLYGIKYRSSWGSFILFIVLFLGTIYQRPLVFDALMVFLFSVLARKGDYIGPQTISKGINVKMSKL